MREQFLPSGRVHYFPNCEVSAEGGGYLYIWRNHRHHRSPVRRRRLYAGACARYPEPDYAVDEGARPINALPQVAGPNRVYTIIGGGKTAMDAVLWLLANDVDPQKIHWVRPRDS